MLYIHFLAGSIRKLPDLPDLPASKVKKEMLTMALIWKGQNVTLVDGNFNRSGYGFQVRFYENGKQKRKMVPGDTDAVSYAKELDRRVNTGEMFSYKTEAELTFADYMEIYVRELDQRVVNFRNDSRHGHKIAPSTRKKYMVAINKHILPFFSRLCLTEIKASTVKRFQTQMQKHLAPQTANQTLNRLSSFMSFCVEQEYIDINPCREVKRLQEWEPEEGYTPDISEVAKAILHAREQWHSVLIKLCAETGVRISEALGLEWTNIKGDILWIQQAAVRQEIGPNKTRNGKRKVPITQELSFMLKEMRVKSSSKYVFVNKNAKLLTSTDALRQALLPACKLAGIERFTWHGLRRFYINYQLDSGKRLDHVQKLVGHSIGSKVTDSHYRRIKEEDVLHSDFRIAI